MGPAVICPVKGSEWSQSEMAELVNIIRWYRGQGLPKPGTRPPSVGVRELDAKLAIEQGVKEERGRFFSTAPVASKITDSTLELLQLMEAENTLEGEIRIYHKAAADNYTWKISPMKNGLALWRNNEFERDLEEVPPAAA